MSADIISLVGSHRKPVAPGTRPDPTPAEIEARSKRYDEREARRDARGRELLLRRHEIERHRYRAVSEDPERACDFGPWGDHATFTAELKERLRDAIAALEGNDPRSALKEIKQAQWRLRDNLIIAAERHRKITFIMRRERDRQKELERLAGGKDGAA